MEMQLILCVSILIFNMVFGSEFENADSYHERCKEFEKEMGKPNIYYDENKDLVMSVKIYRGASNRVIDSGMNSVGIQLKEDNISNVNEELVRFLSQVLNVNKTFFNVLPGDSMPLNKSVKIKGSVITAYHLIDKLVAALEVTAREEPTALCVTDSPELGDSHKQTGSQETDSTKEFDWRNKEAGR